MRTRWRGNNASCQLPLSNLQLSQERADNVMAELVRQGIDSARMSAKGYGAENPIGVTDKPNTA